MPYYEQDTIKNRMRVPLIHSGKHPHFLLSKTRTGCSICDSAGSRAMQYPWRLPAQKKTAGRNLRFLALQVMVQLFFQVVLEKSTAIGRISSRPANMSTIMTHLDSGLYAAKLQVGPTASKPGPMLLKVAMTAEKFVSMEKPSSEITRKLTEMMIT